jgi:hypothetical protein
VLLELDNAPKEKIKIWKAHQLTLRNSEVPPSRIQVRLLGISYRPTPFILGSTVHSETILTRHGKPLNSILHQNVACLCHAFRCVTVSTTRQQTGKSPARMYATQRTHLSVVKAYNFANK